MYNSSGIDGDDDGVRDSGVDSGEQCGERADPVLDSLSDSYSELDTVSVDVSEPSDCPTSHHLLITYSINYCSKERVNKKTILL